MIMQELTLARHFGVVGKAILFITGTLLAAIATAYVVAALGEKKVKEDKENNED